MAFAVGDRFHVVEAVPVMSAGGSMIRTRFLPGFTYEVRPESQPFVELLAGAGKIVRGPSPKDTGPRVKVRGKATIGEAK